MSKLKIFLYLLFISYAFSQYYCDWYTINSDGKNLTNTNYQAKNSLSQNAIGYLTSPNYLGFIGFWIREPQVSIKEKEELTNPHQLETKLYNPFPNPFFHKTRILFSLKNQSNVKLFIYDRMGRIIKILINENKKPGIYSVNWQGENNFQQKVNPGIYFSKFQTGDYYEIKKITFIW